MVLVVENRTISVTDEGFLQNHLDWDEAVTQQLAAAENFILSEHHWEIIRFIRNYYEQYQHLPNMRMFVKAVAKTLGEEKGNSRYLHRLFPGSPLKYSCKLAGLPKPPNCL